MLRLDCKTKLRMYQIPVQLHIINRYQRYNANKTGVHNFVKEKNKYIIGNFMFTLCTYLKIIKLKYRIRNIVNFPSHEVNQKMNHQKLKLNLDYALVSYGGPLKL
jgi:hypothetical protein